MFQQVILTDLVFFIQFVWISNSFTWKIAFNWCFKENFLKLGNIVETKPL